tara:strand:- start:2716 stop:4554 length:1839 start_codon:yes stop_codon:yes gene_type:complete
MTNKTLEEKMAERKAMRARRKELSKKREAKKLYKKNLSKRIEKAVEEETPEWREKKYAQVKRSKAATREKKRLAAEAAEAALTPEEREARDKAAAEVKYKAAERKVALSQHNALERELAQRELCRRKLIACVIRFNPDYMAGWVHKDICMRLEKFAQDVLAGKSPRLMLQMPPRHGKSQLASIDFPAWFLGNHPSKEVIECSYSVDLALDFSRAVRERLRDPEFQVLFRETRLDPNNQNAVGWKTTKRGGYLPAGVRGPITGKGADVLIIDDPIKNAEEAESETMREGIWKWYTTTAYTRLAPGAGVLVIQTRWHDDDLSGRLELKMERGEGDIFEVVRYPATATEDEKYRNKGDALHPERYPEKELARIQRAVGPRTWDALYQQNPVPDEGAYFQRSMFHFYDPDKLNFDEMEVNNSSAWDLAIGQKDQNDYTVGMTWSRAQDNNLYVRDMRRGRWDSYSIVNELCDNYDKYKPSIIGIERGMISLAIGPYLDEVIQDRNLYSMYVEELSVGKRDKVARARAIQGLMRQGKVFFPHPDKAPWVTTVMNEFLRFPNGKHDDIVDALAWLGLMLDSTQMIGDSSQKIPAQKSWKDKLTAILQSGSSNKSSMSA